MLYLCRTVQYVLIVCGWFFGTRKFSFHFFGGGNEKNSSSEFFFFFLRHSLIQEFIVHFQTALESNTVLCIEVGQA